MDIETPPMRDKALKKKVAQLSEKRLEKLRELTDGDECKFQFIVWAEGTRLDVSGILKGEPIFRPAVCAWEAWKGAWALLHKSSAK